MGVMKGTAIAARLSYRETGNDETNSMRQDEPLVLDVADPRISEYTTWQE